ncbi:hypothetical protein ACFQ2B_20925 [Streptomyces stramineus]|uniref:Secreted protein n=1 Tax=Streptomyces stramineus TaxID=173861 RepID=A0ABN1AE56_9ACTN
MFHFDFRRPVVAVAVCAAVLGVAVPAVAAAPVGAAPVGAGQHRPAAGQYDAKQVHAFLTGFYGQHGPSPAARKNKVTEELKKKAAATKDYDLLLCAQNTPRSIAIGKVTTAQSAGMGWATVTTKWGGGPDGRFTAYVGLDASKPLKLADIVCGDLRR